MRSKARIAGHPIHPMLMLLPAGAFVTVLLCDLIHLATGVALWWEATRPVLLIGVAGGLLAAIPGLIDLLAIPPDRKARRIGWWHGGLNLLVVVVFAWNAGLRWAVAQPPVDVPHFGFWLTLVGSALLAVSGWLGGTLVYRHGVGVAGRDSGATPAGAAAGAPEGPVESRSHS